MDLEAGRLFHDVTIADLGSIRKYVREEAVSGDCDPALIDEMVVAVNEATENIVRHGYHKEPGDIWLTVVCGSDCIQVTLLDNSSGFDPTSAPDPDTTLPLAERPFGGMGVHFMRTFCDEVSYRRDSRSRNELILLKRSAA